MKNAARPFDWIFFDIGGPLVDDAAAVKQRIEINLRVLQHYRPELTRADILAAWPRACGRIGSVDRNLAFILIDNEAQAGRAFEEVVREKAVATPYLKQVFVRKGAPEICAQLAKHYQLGFLANQAGGIRKILADADLLRHFSHQKVSEDYRLEKPDPEFFERVFEETKADPRRSVMIDDNIERSLLTAKCFGMTTIWYKLAEREAPPGICDHAVRSLDELLSIFLKNTLRS